MEAFIVVSERFPKTITHTLTILKDFNKIDTKCLVIYTKSIEAKDGQSPRKWNLPLFGCSKSAYPKGRS